MKIKKIIAVFLAVLTCILTLSAGASAADAKKGISLSKTKLTLTLGMEYKLKPTVTGISDAKVTMSTSDKSVVSISGGVLKANKAGTAEITVKVKNTNYSAKCKVTVRLPKTTSELVNSMGNGYMISNSLSVTDAYWVTDIKDYETAWGQPRLSKKLMTELKKVGLNTVGFTVRWDDHMDSKGNISKEWLDRVQEVVDYAYDQDMYVIIDSADGWISVKNEKAMRTKFKAMWKQIAARFKDYDQKLIFHGLSASWWAVDEEDGYFPVSARKVLNNLNSDFVKTVRSTGGKNKTRFLLLSPSNEYESMVVPDDDYVLIGLNLVHPFEFADINHPDNNIFTTIGVHQIEEKFKSVNDVFIKKGYDVVITQFGYADKSNTDQRVNAVKYYLNYAEKYNIPCLWASWTDELLDRETFKWKSSKILERLTR